MIKRTTYIQDEFTATDDILDRARRELAEEGMEIVNAAIVSAWPIGDWWERTRGVEVEVTLEK